MRKFVLLVLILAVVAMATTGCDLIVKDAEVDAQTVIIEVAGNDIVKADVQQAIEGVLDYQEYIYSMYGIRFDRTDPESVASAQETAIAGLIEEAVTDQKIGEYKLNQFTDAELAEMAATAADTYAGYIETVKTYYFADSELTGEELDAAVEDMMAELGYGTEDELLEQAKDAKALERLKAYVVEDVAITEDDIQAEYDSNIAAALSAYASDKTQYLNDVNSGAILYATPGGYRYVKNLLVKITDEEQQQIAALEADIAEKEETKSAVEAAIAELPEADEDSQENQDERSDLEAQVDALNAEIDTLNAELNQATIAAYSAIQPTVNMIVSKLEAGEDFDELMAEYGEDTGMTQEPEKTTGYLVCDGLTSYVAEFVDASMALEAVGDVSDPFRTNYGVHIVKYVGDLATGETPLEEIHDRVAEELLTARQDAFYDETVSQWVTEANAKIYANKLAD